MPVCKTLKLQVVPIFAKDTRRKHNFRIKDGPFNIEMMRNLFEDNDSLEFSTQISVEIVIAHI